MKLIITKNTPFGECQTPVEGNWRDFVKMLDTIGTDGITNITIDTPNLVSVSRHSLDEDYYIEIKMFPYGLRAASWCGVADLIQAVASFYSGKRTEEIKRTIITGLAGVCYMGGLL